MVHTYLVEDEVAVFSIAAEEINTLAIKHVSGNDGAVYIDREANIRGDYLHRDDVCTVTRKKQFFKNFRAANEDTCRFAHIIQI